MFRSLLPASHRMQRREMRTHGLGKAVATESRQGRDLALTVLTTRRLSGGSVRGDDMPQGGHAVSDPRGFPRGPRVSGPCK